jgi:hypothetical protein
MQNNKNSGIVIAVLCLVIGVVLGAVVVNTKSVAPSQEGAAIKSGTTQTVAVSKVDPELQKAVASGKGKYLDMKKQIRDTFIASGGSPSSTLYIYQCASIGFYVIPMALTSGAGTCDFLGTIEP